MSRREREPDEEDLDFGEPGGDDAPAPGVDDERATDVDFGADGEDPAVPAIDEDDATPAGALDGLELTDEVALPREVIVDWTTTATLPDLGLLLAAVLDPTAAKTTWWTPRPEAPGRVRIAVGDVIVSLVVDVQRSEEEMIRLGRDFLAGRILVRS